MYLSIWQGKASRTFYTFNKQIKELDCYSSHLFKNRALYSPNSHYNIL